MTSISLQPVLHNLPANAPEAIVASNFSYELLKALGFESNEIYPEYQTGDGKSAVDLAVRKNNGNNIFLHTKSNPYLLVELKGRDVNLASGSPQYKSTVAQIKRYLLGASCKSAQWGIITNADHIQLFRKHGKVIYPATPCYVLDTNNIDNRIAEIRHKIESASRALTVTVYNNKGGVGKTTTTINLAGILTLAGKKVLVIDFDPNQHDLTRALGISLSQGSVYDFLTERNIPVDSALCSYEFFFKTKKLQVAFDVIPADEKFSNTTDDQLLKLMTRHRLHQVLESVRNEYDYILIDSPPNWRILSQLAVFAADVILIPTKHNSLFSLQNAAVAIKKFIPEIQAEKKDGSPIALPIFFNGEKITNPQLEAAQHAIHKIITDARKEKVDLLPYFYPRHTNAKKDLHVAIVPSYAGIASSAFSNTPAVYRDRTAHEYYKNLAKEYFLQ
ncbi:AAA family ATPase [Oscillatoria sp. FACHB-1406]|uniref:AAA family ATPase n=1 Tax=Oscillatoria sp. FACHB-1406 TaxID=2692846 RepID=UPI00168A1B9B|nr:AAA family ATPase [Oscillatoria sp. FACHB-1406]MBD2579061.1 AAA family ATPase [Oscillatoria sp. FACHB-1406]